MHAIISANKTIITGFNIEITKLKGLIIGLKNYKEKDKFTQVIEKLLQKSTNIEDIIEFKNLLNLIQELPKTNKIKVISTTDRKSIKAYRNPNAKKLNPSVITNNEIIKGKTL